MAFAAALALIALAAWIVMGTRSRDPALLVSSQRPIAAFGASYRQATLSPDGGFVAFADAGAPVTQIWIKNLAQGDPIQITSGDVDASHPAWSPKNDQIVFARRGQGLWSVPPLGGNARRLLEFGASPQFSTDGERLVFERNAREIWTAQADGSEARRVQGVPVPWYSGPPGSCLLTRRLVDRLFHAQVGPEWGFVDRAGGRRYAAAAHARPDGGRRAGLDSGWPLHLVQLDARRQPHIVARAAGWRCTGAVDRRCRRGSRPGRCRATAARSSTRTFGTRRSCACSIPIPARSG